MEVTNAALGGGAGAKRGTIVIGTVAGDVHDIGKAIVIAYLKANSFEVHDLGRDCPIDTFLAKAEEHGADVIGMSALLTTTMEEQKKLIARLVAEGRREAYKVVVGGAPATQRWADQIGADAYAEDASDGVKKIEALLAQRRGEGSAQLTGVLGVQGTSPSRDPRRPRGMIDAPTCGMGRMHAVPQRRPE